MLKILFEGCPPLLAAALAAPLAAWFKKGMDFKVEFLVGLGPDMHGPNGQNVTIWGVTRCFCGYLMNLFEKMPKSPIF